MRLPDKPLGPLRRRVVLALVSLATLTVGLAVAPEPSQQAGRPIEAPAPILREITAERPYEQLTTALQAAADTARPFVVSFDGGGLGLAVGDGQVLTTAAAVEHRARDLLLRLPGGDALPGEPVAHDPEAELVLVQVRAGAPLPVAPAAAALPAPGALVFTTGRAAGGPLLAPAFVTAVGDAEIAIGGSGREFPAGAPLFTMVPEAVAVVVGAGRALRLDVALRRVRARVGAPDALPVGLGLVLQEGPPLGDGADHRVIVADVLPRSPAAAADVRGGDRVVAIDGHPVTTAAAAEGALSARRGAGGTVALTLARGRRTLEAVIVPELLLGADWRTPPMLRDVGAPLASEIFPVAALRAAALDPETRVLTVDGARPARPLGVTPKPVLAHVSLHGRRRFVVVPGSRP